MRGLNKLTIISGCASCNNTSWMKDTFEKKKAYNNCRESFWASFNQFVDRWCSIRSVRVISINVNFRIMPIAYLSRIQTYCYHLLRCLREFGARWDPLVQLQFILVVTVGLSKVHWKRYQIMSPTQNFSYFSVSFIFINKILCNWFNY